MSAIEIILGAVLLAIALFLIVVILLQESKKGGLSGTITGSAETFYSKTKGKSASKFLRTSTTVAAIVFAVLVLVAYLFSGIGR